MVPNSQELHPEEVVAVVAVVACPWVLQVAWEVSVAGLACQTHLWLVSWAWN